MLGEVNGVDTHDIALEININYLNVYFVSITVKV